MQANNILSAGRFSAYLKKHLVDNYRFYGMAVVVITGLALLLLTFAGMVNANFSSYSDLLPMYFIGLYVTGLIFTSMSFNELGNKPRGIDYLLLPASHLEKFLTTLLITTIGFLIVYHFAFFLAAKVLDIIVSIRSGRHIKNDLFEFSHHNMWQLNYYFWIIAQSVFFLGAVYFHKYSFIKTTFWVILFCVFLYLVNGLFVQIFFHGKMADWRAHIPFVGLGLSVPPVDDPIIHRQEFIMLPKGMSDVFVFIGEYLIAPMLWTVAYFRLRDKEI